MLRTPLYSLAVAVALAAAPCAQTAPTGFVVDTMIGSGLNSPLDFDFLADGRVLVANRAGAVSIWADGVGTATIGTVPSVETVGERGLLSIAADPDFATNGFFYVYYASSADAFLHLDRFTCTGQLSNPSSTAVTFSSATRRAILGAIPDTASNHNGGAARFGPDGMLYLTVGDDGGTNYCLAQNPSSSLGCLVRMNVDVAVLGSGANTTPPAFSVIDPGDNPLSANSDFSQLVIAHGLRNPFRMEIDQVTGNCYIGDVGLSTREEYSEYVYPSVGALPLRNFGWPWREGLTTGPYNCGGGAPTGTINPLADVNYSPWTSIMGGPRYRNQGGVYDFGPAYEGDAFFHDYAAGEMRRLDHNGTSWPANATVWTTGFSQVTALRQGPDGALWFCHTSSGTLKRIRPLGPTNSVVAISGGSQVGSSGQTFPLPLVARVFDTMNAPLPGGTVNFAITGPGVLSMTNPVIADANGDAMTMVTASSTSGGTITVTASTPGSQTTGVFTLVVRRLAVTVSGSLFVISVTNATNAVPAQVPMVVAMSFPRTPILPTAVGPMFANPYAASTLVLMDSFSHFPTTGWQQLGSSPNYGTPSLSKIYNNVPVAMFAGQRMTFQVAGYDPLTGWFVTNTEVKQF